MAKKDDARRATVTRDRARGGTLADVGAGVTPKYAIVAPADLSATEIDVDGETFVLFEWSSAPLFLDGLTKAERDVVTGILRGESNGAIAKRRGTHVRTVANQVAGIFRKLGAGSRAELVARLTRTP